MRKVKFKVVRLFFNGQKRSVFAGYAIFVATHEMGFARAVMDRMYFFDEGLIIESSTPEDIFHNPQEERTKLSLSQILQQ